MHATKMNSCNGIIEQNHLVQLRWFYHYLYASIITTRKNVINHIHSYPTWKPKSFQTFSKSANVSARFETPYRCMLVAPIWRLGKIWNVSIIWTITVFGIRKLTLTEKTSCSTKITIGIIFCNDYPDRITCIYIKSLILKHHLLF